MRFSLANLVLLVLILILGLALAGCSSAPPASRGVRYPDAFGAHPAASRIRVACEETIEIALLEHSGVVLPVPGDAPCAYRLSLASEEVSCDAGVSWWRTVLANVIPLGGFRAFSRYEGTVTRTYALEEAAAPRSTLVVASSFDYVDFAWVDRNPRHHPLRQLIAAARADAAAQLVRPLFRDLGVAGWEGIALVDERADPRTSP